METLKIAFIKPLYAYVIGCTVIRTGAYRRYIMYPPEWVSFNSIGPMSFDTSRILSSIVYTTIVSNKITI